MKRAPAAPVALVLAASFAAVVLAQGGPQSPQAPPLVTSAALMKPSPEPEGDSALQVHITSPLGRMGTPGAVRIVAQIQTAPGVVLHPVRFFVDDQLLATVESGPPYAAEWTDENPFEPRKIVVEADDETGRRARDEVNLKPFEITEVSDVRSVLLETGVYDKEGRFITDLSEKNFTLQEDNVPQPIQLVSQEQLPTTFALLIDSSQSMARRYDFVQLAASEIVRFMRPKDRVIVAPFGRGLKPVTGPTGDPRTVAEAIAAARAEGGTAIYDSVVELSGRLKGLEGRRAIVLITDGWDENSRLTLADALKAAQSADATVYVLAIGGVAGVSLRGEDALRELALQTAGRAFFPAREGELPLVYERLASDAQHRYLITYTPTNQRRDGRWHSISLRTVPVDYIVRTRDGYLAPPPLPVRTTLEFTATDLDDHYVDISRDDLKVVEDGTTQTVDAFAEAVSPLSIILALDQSGSMKKSAEQVMEAARTFVRSLRPEDSLALLVFSDKVLVAHSLSKNRDWSLQAIDQYRAEGGTALYDSLFGSLHMLKDVTGRRAIVVVTDGVDEDRTSKHAGSTHTLDDVVALAKQVDTSIFTVGLGRQVAPRVLNQLAQVSGGRAYFPSDVSALPEQYQRIVENLRRRYMLSYTSTNSTRDGAWRSVEISARQPNVHIISRKGYFAPER